MQGTSPAAPSSQSVPPCCPGWARSAVLQLVKQAGTFGHTFKRAEIALGQLPKICLGSVARQQC